MYARRMALLVMLLALFAAMGVTAAGCPGSFHDSGGSGVNIDLFQEHSGANLPWINYGWDLGENPWGGAHGGFSSNGDTLDAGFGFLAGRGVRLVRVFLFCDLRAGLTQSGNTIEFEPVVYDDMGALLDAARAHGLMLMPVLLDYLVADGVANENGNTVGERPDLLTTDRDAFVSLLSEFLATYGNHPSIYAWDVMNEPELAGAVTLVEVGEFIAAVAEAIHENTTHLATTGSFRRDLLLLYPTLGLDIYQFHHYDYMEASLPLDFPVADLGLDKPVLIGEIEPTNVAAKLQTIEDNGYHGALFWSLRAGDGSEFRGSADEFAGYFDG